jgi:predicted transcriptional regulator
VKFRPGFPSLLLGLALLALGGRPTAQTPAASPTPLPSVSATVGEGEDEEEAARKPPAPIDFSNVHDPDLRRRLEQLAGERLSRPSAGVRMKFEPWLAPTGEQLVGIVEQRTMTKPQLERRVQLLLKQSPPIKDPKLAEDQRVMYESQVLAEWIENTALAVYAEQLGIAVSDQEVQQALDQLANRTHGSASPQVSDQVRLIGFRESELRQEARDALLVEKVVRRGIRELVTDTEMRDIYAKYPKNLLFDPTRVRAWQLYYPVTRRLNRREEKQVTARLADWRKKLARAATPDDYKALQAQLGGGGRLLQRDEELTQLHQSANLPGVAPTEPERPVLIDMGWIAAGDLIPPAIHQQLFGLKAGETSKVFQSETKDRDLGYNAVKVVERVEGEHGSFEQAKPHIENLVFDHVRDLVYEAAKIKLKIYSDSSGLKKWQTLGPAPTPAVGPMPAPATQEPDLNPLRRDLSRSRGDASALNPPSVEEVLRRNAAARLHPRESESQPVQKPPVAPPPPQATPAGGR